MAFGALTSVGTNLLKAGVSQLIGGGGNPAVVNAYANLGKNIWGGIQRKGSALSATTSAGSGSYSGGGTGARRTGYSSGYAAPVDPLAQQKAQWMSMLPGAIANIRQNGQEAFGTGERNMRGTAENLFNTVLAGQKGINSSRENVELNRLNGVKDILGFVRNGLKSGGAMLSNMNALESSAAGEIGRAYTNEGTDRSRKVSNQAFLDNRVIDTSQEGLDRQENQGVRDLERSRDDMVQTIGSQVRNQLFALDAQGQNLGITGKVAIDQEKQRVIDEGLAKLNAVDQWLKQQLGTVNPQDMETTKRNAIALQQGGQGDITPFNFGEDSTLQPISGPQVSQLPLFTRNRKQE